MKLVFSRAFEDDLLGITDYISNKLQNPQASERLVKDIFNEIDKLKSNPELGTSLSWACNVFCVNGQFHK